MASLLIRHQFSVLGLLSKIAQQPRVSAVVQDIWRALQSDAPLVDEQHLVGDELGIFGL